MVNWVANRLIISGNEKDLVAFIGMVKDDDPLGILNLENEDNQAYDPEFIDNDLICQFETKGSPPLEWVGEVAKTFPDLTFDLQYSEPMMGLYSHRVFNGNAIIIGHFCDRCEKQRECKKEIYTAILTLMETIPEKWPKSPDCEDGCSWESICALINGGNSCVLYGCWSLRIEPFNEFLATRRENLETIQIIKKDLKRYRRIDLKTYEPRCP